jgi:hypothetical protein
METIQLIKLDGRVLAVVAGNRAIIADELVGADRLRVQAKALYALEVRAGERPGPYSDDAAERYASALGAGRSSSSISWRTTRHRGT